MVQGYLRALGMPRTAQVKRDARIGEAEARRDAGIKVTNLLIYVGLLSPLEKYLYRVSEMTYFVSNGT